MEGPEPELDDVIPGYASTDSDEDERMIRSLQQGGNDDFWTSARKGDLQRIKFLVEVEQSQDLNRRDAFDSCPLYYASLCGHIDIVRYLLEHGATLDDGTFEAHRCYYGAYNDEIRGLLRSYKANPFGQDMFVEYLKRRMVADEPDEHADVEFNVSGHAEKFHLHRCVLSCRNACLAKLIQGRWRDKRVIELPSTVSWLQGSTVVTLLYTERVDLTMDAVEQVRPLLNKLGCEDIVARLDAECELAMRANRGQVPILKSQRVHRIVVKPPAKSITLRTNFLSLLQDATVHESADTRLSDVALQVDGIVLYLHRFFIEHRCDWLRVIISGNFKEGSQMTALPSGRAIPFIELHNMEYDVFMIVLRFLYTDTLLLSNDPGLIVNGDGELSQEQFQQLIHVLETASMLLLDGLVSLCLTAMIRSVTPANVIQILDLGSTLSLERLLHYCTNFISQNLSEVLGEPIQFEESRSEITVCGAPRLQDLEDWMRSEPTLASELLQELITQHCAEHWETICARCRDSGMVDTEILRVKLPEMLSRMC